MTIDEEIKVFNELTTHMNAVFEKKRNDYGQTTTETFIKFGPVSMLTRMHDKIGRLDNLLVHNKANYVGEAVEDTLLDLANYALITIIELEKQKERTLVN